MTVMNQSSYSAQAQAQQSRVQQTEADQLLRGDFLSEMGVSGPSVDLMTDEEKKSIEE